MLIPTLLCTPTPAAKSFADKGHAQIQQGFKQLDQRVPLGSQKRTDSSSSLGTVPAGGSPGLATYTAPAPPPPPPTRTAGPGGPPPPPGRGRAGSAASSSYGVAAPPTAGGKGVFSGMDQREKEAFFALLDEYFASRPQFASLFQGGGSPAPYQAAAPPAPPAASRPSPAPPAGLGTAVALYAFDGTQAEDLPFAEGERITVLEIGAPDLPSSLSLALP